MKTITLYFYNEDHLGRELNSIIFDFQTDLSGEDLHRHINLQYSDLLGEYKFYSMAEITIK